MAEELERTEFEYTYTYDQFTVFFYGDRIFIGKKAYPIGQCCVDILNLDEAVLDEIDCQRRCDFAIFRRTGNVRKWRIKECSL